MDSIVIGVIYNAGTFTAATRRGTVFGSIKQQANVSEGEALAMMFDLANAYRHENPMVHIAGDDSARIVESIRRAGIPCEVFAWFAPTNSGFANRGSMQFSELQEQINVGARTGPVDELLIAELEAFEEVGTAGKVEFLRPSKVADAIERYPNRALSILLANQFAGAPATQYRPLASDNIPVQHNAGGHDPFAVLKG